MPRDNKRGLHVRRPPRVHVPRGGRRLSDGPSLGQHLLRTLDTDASVVAPADQTRHQGDPGVRSSSFHLPVIAHLEHGYSLREIATRLGCSVTTVHRRVRSCRDEGTRRRWPRVERRRPDRAFTAEALVHVVACLTSQPTRHSLGFGQGARAGVWSRAAVLPLRLRPLM